MSRPLSPEPASQPAEPAGTSWADARGATAPPPAAEAPPAPPPVPGSQTLPVQRLPLWSWAPFGDSSFIDHRALYSRSELWQVTVIIEGHCHN